MKITVIATGFDRPSAATQVAASAAETPVDLQSYTAWRQETGEKIAATGGSNVRMPMTRRAVLEMPIIAAAADPASETVSPGAEFEPVSPLDVPAFLRRQHEL
ncbi:MAG: hypothetical protein DMF86_00550 [Acidobacteria bacterium]|nr:MAG: hypothetical protein DMF86_00550 [Acidobacteriota bacterium]